MKKSYPGEVPLEEANIAKVKAHFSRFLRLVKAGREITILDRRHPVARLIPFRSEGESLEVESPTEDPASLPALLSQPALPRPTGSLGVLLADRKKR